VIGIIELPSTAGVVGLCFLPNAPAAADSEGATSPPLKDPSAARKERRLQGKFSFMGGFLSTLLRT
jgi:hypothetical protein